MKKIKYTENDLYNAMVRNVDEDAVVYGANGHYAIGAYYDITKIVSTNGTVDYNNGIVIINNLNISSYELTSIHIHTVPAIKDIPATRNTIIKILEKFTDVIVTPVVE